MAKAEIVLGEVGSGNIGYYGNHTYTLNQADTINLGFQPIKHILFWKIYNNHAQAILLDVENNKVYNWYESNDGGEVPAATIATIFEWSVSGSQFTFKPKNAMYAVKLNIMAVGV